MASSVGCLLSFPLYLRAVHIQAHQLFTVTYGGMAKTALALPPSLFIFRKLTSCVVVVTIRALSLAATKPFSAHGTNKRTQPFLPNDSVGFWLSNWVQTHPEERQTMMRSLAELTGQGKLKEPETEVVELAGSDEEVAEKMSGVMKRIEEGRGKKILLHWKDE